jgi:hypothetical protein
VEEVGMIEIGENVLWQRVAIGVRVGRVGKVEKVEKVWQVDQSHLNWCFVVWAWQIVQEDHRVVVVVVQGHDWVGFGCCFGMEENRKLTCCQEDVVVAGNNTQEDCHMEEDC